MKVAPIFSQEDEDLADPRWYISGHAYPSRCPKAGIKEFAHRIVLSRKLGRPLTPQDICDHANGNILDCRRENIRLTDHSGNQQNRKCGRYRGVTFHKATGKWQAAVQSSKLPYKERFLGLFRTRKEASLAAAVRRKELGFLERAST